MAQPVVITGVGVVSPVGSGKAAFWEACLKGQSGIRRITAFDVTGYKSQVAGEVIDVQPEALLSPQQSHRMERFAQFGLAAARMALEDAGVNPGKMDPYRVGISCGSGLGGMAIGETQLRVLYETGLPGKVSPGLVPMLMLNAVSGQLAMAFGAKGPNLTVSTACSSGAHAIGHALDLIRHGRADVMIAGGAEACILPLTLAGFCSLRSLSTRYNDTPAIASRPFDRNRDGLVMGEGAGMLILESLDHAHRRGATIYAELAGYGATSEAHHLVIPNPDGQEAARTMAFALADAGLSTGDIDYINAHATSTPVGDAAETAAIKWLFKDRAYRIPVSSTKSMIGHTIGAAGAIEAVVCALSLRYQQVHPTINYETPDPSCDLDYVPQTARDLPVRAALSNSFGFGSNNASLVFKRWA